MFEVGLALLGKIDLGVERQVPRRKDGNVDAGHSHDHPAGSGQPAGEGPMRPGTVGCGVLLVLSTVLTGASCDLLDCRPR